MTEIVLNIKKHNSFKLECCANNFEFITELSDLRRIQKKIEIVKDNFFILGGGSNTLFVTEKYEGLLLINRYKGINILEEDDNCCYIEVKSGTKWSELIEFCSVTNLYGIEFLSGIPGTVGASPVQNISAYGQQVSDAIQFVECINLRTQEVILFTKNECEFSYRNSIFKYGNKDMFISKVVFVFHKAPSCLNIHKEIQHEISSQCNSITKVSEIIDAVKRVRQAKIPDPDLLGNAGSIFINPTISLSSFNKLINTYPSMPYYAETHNFKIPAAWLIQQAGWKGWKSKELNYGVYEKHAQIIVNYGGAKGAEVLNLIFSIRKSVYKQFEIWLTPEIKIVKSFSVLDSNFNFLDKILDY